MGLNNYLNLKVEIAKIVLPLAPSVFSYWGWQQNYYIRIFFCAVIATLYYFLRKKNHLFRWFFNDYAYFMQRPLVELSTIK